MRDDPSVYPGFDGRDRLVAAIDHAVQRGEASQVTAALRQVLQQAIADEHIRLPDCVHQPIHDHYARRELYRSAEHGYSVIAMTWGPAQATPLHDHSGLWCVEGVWSGTLQITQYELLEHAQERFRFRAGVGLLAGRGSAGCLIPPHEYHTICNPSREEIAVSVHVYQGVMEQTSIFEPVEAAASWYRRRPHALAMDAPA